MKRCRKILLIVITMILFAGALCGALYFMGVIRYPKEAVDSQEDGEQDSILASADEAWDEENLSEDYWHIIFEGFEFCVKPIGLAKIHESGCLNIRNCDEFLIQIDVEDKTVDDFWENREERIRSIEEAGYTIKLAPEKMDVDGRTYIRYIVCLENERGADFDESYFYVLISDASAGKRFLATVRFDGIDVAVLGTEEREKLYAEALQQTTDIISSAQATDKADDVAGSYWEKEEPIADFTEDSISADDITIAYKLPEYYYLASDNEAGKTYYSEKEKTHITTSVIPYSWVNAEEMAESKTSAGISDTISEGKYEINGLTYYYYVYSVMVMKGDERSYSYHFHAYADLENGDIYSIYGYSDLNSEIMEVEYYDVFMDIEETVND